MKNFKIKILNYTCFKSYNFDIALLMLIVIADQHHCCTFSTWLWCTILCFPKLWHHNVQRTFFRSIFSSFQFWKLEKIADMLGVLYCTAADQLRKERILVTHPESSFRVRSHVHQRKYKSCNISQIVSFHLMTRCQITWTVYPAMLEAPAPLSDNLLPPTNGLSPSIAPDSIPTEVTSFPPHSTLPRSHSFTSSIESRAVHCTTKRRSTQQCYWLLCKCKCILMLYKCKCIIMQCSALYKVQSLVQCSAL